MTAHTPDGYTEFRFFRPDASQVFVAGDFNNWRTDQVAMTRQEGGWWCVRLPLPAGQYRFRYFADGLWYTDFAAFGVEPGRFGLDSLLHIPPQAATFPASRTPAAEMPTSRPYAAAA
jgi:1,4-alpha-glucan branching enzyme